MSLTEKQVPLDAEDYKLLNSSKRWSVGCLVIFAVVAILAIVFYVRDTIGELTLGLVVLVCVPITALMLWARKRDSRHMESGVKKVITTPIKRTYGEYIGQGPNKFYVVIDEKWTILGTEKDERSYKIEEELFDRLKNGDVIEMHKLLDDTILRIIKVADAPGENPKTL